MACNFCNNSCGGIVFPDFVANSCCNPCCDNSNVGGVNDSTCGCGNSCGCNSCGNAAGSSCGCGCSSCLPGCNAR